MTEASEKHGGFRELLDAVGDDVHQVSRKRKDVPVSRRTRGKLRVGDPSKPRSQHSRLAVPMLHKLLEGCIVRGIESINRKRSFGQPDAPRPLILELVNKRCA